MHAFFIWLAQTKIMRLMLLKYHQLNSVTKKLKFIRNSILKIRNIWFIWKLQRLVHSIKAPISFEFQRIISNNFKKITILMIRNGKSFPELSAGSEVTIHHLAKEFALDGHEVLIAATTENEDRLEVNDYQLIISKRIEKSIYTAILI